LASASGSILASGEVEESVRHSAEMRRLAERTGDTGLRMIARAGDFIARLGLGRLPEALALAEETLELSGGDPERGRGGVARGAARRFRRDVPQVLKQADLLLHTARDEPFGRALIEAMASSLPVVAAAGGGVEEVVEDGLTGVVVRSNSPEAWVGAIEKLYQDPPLRRQMGTAGRRRAEELFSIQSHVAGVERVYEEVLSSGQ